MHYYQFNIGDYRKDTGHLTPIEHYIYRTLIDWYFLDETPLPNIEKILRKLGLTNDRSTDVQQVLNDFFKPLDDRWEHERIERDISIYKGLKKSASDAGKASAAARKAKKDGELQRPFNDRSTDVQQTSNQEPVTNNHKPIKEKTKEITFPEFLQICKDKNEMPIPADDSIYGWAEKVKLPQDMLLIAWNAFKARNWKDAKGKEKKYIDWRKAFRQYCENPDWLDVWSINRDGEFYLTPKGKLLERELHE